MIRISSLTCGAKELKSEIRKGYSSKAACTTHTVFLPHTVFLLKNGIVITVAAATIDPPLSQIR